MNLPHLRNISFLFYLPTPRPFLNIAGYRKAIDLSQFFPLAYIFFFLFKVLFREKKKKKDKHTSYNKCHKKYMFWQTFPNL